MITQISQSENNVTITDVNMPFWSMVRFMVKAALASIPAIIILWIIGVLLIVAMWLIIAGLGLGIAGLSTLSAPKSSPVMTPSPVASNPLLAQPSPAQPAASTEKGYATVRSEDFGDDWPLTVDKARVWCEPGGAILLISNQKIYAVNDLAKRTFGNQYAAIDEILVSDGEGHQMSVRPLIEAGRKVCRE